MERLGLWGERAMFSSFEVFLDTVQKKGLGMLTFSSIQLSLRLGMRYCCHLGTVCRRTLIIIVIQLGRHCS